jgi:uncharacterized membrane protein
MANLTSLFLFTHIAAGIITLIAGPIAIFANRKYTKLHKIAGKTFFYAMMTICISSIIGYFRHEGVVFYEFLLGIAILVLAGVLRGIRALKIMKGGTVIPFDWAYTILLAINSLYMLGYGFWQYTQGAEMVFPILFGVFGINALIDVIKNIKMFSTPSDYEKVIWLKLHVQTMIGCFIASTTAFTVNTAQYLPWYIQWFGPTMLLLPLQIYWGRKLKSEKKNVKVQVAHS